MLQQEFEYRSPASCDEAAALREARPGTVYLAGGTDVVPLMKYGLLHPRALIALSGVKGLDAIRVRDDTLEIGAMATLHSLALYAAKREGLGGIARAAKAVASPQIRRIGTVAGNLLQEHRCIYYNQTAQWRQGIETCIKDGGGICHQAPASPACRALYYSDLAPALLSAGARVRVLSQGQHGDFSLEKLCGMASPVDGGLVTAVEVPALSQIAFTCFRKRAVRGAIDFPLANAALTVRADGSARLVMGAMNPAPVFLPETARQVEGLLREGAPFPASLYEQAQREAKSLMRPIREATVSSAVKVQATSVVLEVLRDLQARRPQGMEQL